MVSVGEEGAAQAALARRGNDSFSRDSKRVVIVSAAAAATTGQAAREVGKRRHNYTPSLSPAQAETEKAQSNRFLNCPRSGVRGLSRRASLSVVVTDR